MDKLFPTQEIGSLAKPSWRVKGYQGHELTENEIAEAVSWGEKLGIANLEQLIQVLKNKNSPQRRKAILEWAAKYAIKFFEIAGLDVVFNGEQWRSEMYEHFIRRVSGFKVLGFVKSFDYRYFNKAACIDPPKYIKPIYLEEFLFTKENTTRKIKVPFTGAYTLVDWTFNEFYEKRVVDKVQDFTRRKFEAKKDFLFDLIKNVIRPEIKTLVDSGAEWIQIDEPAATTNPSSEEMELFVEAFNETVRGFNCIFSLHNCYSNYKILAKYAPKLQNCGQLALEFANRDNPQIGLDNIRTSYKEIKFFEEYGFSGNYGLGVIDVHSNFVEPPELIRDRILYAAKIVGDSSRIWVNPDCGLRTRSWDVSFQKLKNMVLGAELARQSLE